MSESLRENLTKKSSNERRHLVTPEEEQQQRADTERGTRQLDDYDDFLDEEEERTEKRRKLTKRIDDAIEVVVVGDEDEMEKEEEEEEEEKVDKEEEKRTCLFTALDLLRELWTREFTPLRNIRLILSAVRGAQYRRDSAWWSVEKRREEASLLCKMLQDLQDMWVYSKSSSDEVHTVDEIIRSIREHTSLKHYLSLYINAFLSANSVREWKRCYKEHISRIFDNAMDRAVESSIAAEAEGSGALTTTTTTMGGGTIERKKKIVDEDTAVPGGSRGGLDALFVDCRENTRDVMQQFVTKVENGRALTIKSPGEKGGEIVRIQVYDTWDIQRREPRVWWKYAKLRTQFISSGSERKKLYLRRLLDQVADELRVLPGVIRESQPVVSRNDTD